MTVSRQKDAAAQVVGRLDRAVREVLTPATVRERAPLQVRAVAVGGEPVPFADGTSRPTTPLAVGEPWGRPWDTVWMHVTGTVPTAWADAGARVETVIDLGFSAAQPGFQAEGLVHTPDGRVVRALSPLNHALPQRSTGAVDYWVEAAANPTLSNEHGTGLKALSHLGARESAGDVPLYRFGGAAVVLRDEEVSALLHDLALLRGIAVDPGAHPRRRALVLAALERMLDRIDPTDVAGTAAAGRAELAAALRAPAAASALTLTAVGHAHIDSAWLWPLRETIRKCARTFSNVVTLMEDDPDFVFGCSSAQQFQWMKQHYPDLYARIRERVAAGQFVPVGGMWVESDTNMPGSESLARQFVAGQLYFEREFGVTCEEVWLPDSFGYSGALPQLARGAGARWFFGQKLSWNRTNRMPHHTFTWEGIDGSRVLTHFTPIDTYNSDLSPAELLHADRNFADHAGFSGALVPYGWGDGGGGPTREMLAAGRRAADVEGLPRVRFGSPREFFATAQDEAEAGRPAVWSGEMYLELHRGTYTSQARTKRGNRRAEALLRQAELWCATAAVRVGAPYPAEALRRIWERTLLLQFHDILPGSSISWVHQDAERMHTEDAAELRGIIDAALTALVGEGTTPLTANASPFARDGVAALGIARAAGPHGVGEVPVEITAEGADHVLSNGRITLRVGADGTFPELADAASGRSLFSAALPGNALHLHQDVPTEWDAWDVDEHYRRVPVETPGDARVTPGEGGTVRIERTVGSSRVTQTVTLDPRAPEVHVTTTVDWHERERLLKLAFPFRIDAATSAAETQFGHVTRPTHTNTSWEEARFEVVAHRWLHVGDGVVGAAVVNDSTYGHDVTRVPDPTRAPACVTQVRQTLLRAPMYPDPDADQGEHTFRTRLVVTPTTAAAVESAFDLDTPPVVLPGARPVEPVVRVEGDTVVVQTVKLAEDGSGDLVVRLYESSGSPARARVGLAARDVRVVDLLERPVDGGPAARDGVVERDLRGFEVLTLRGTPAGD